MDKSMDKILIKDLGEEEIISRILSKMIAPMKIGETLPPLDDVRDFLPPGPRLTFSIDGGGIDKVKLPWRTYSDVGWTMIVGAASDHVVKSSIPAIAMIALGLPPEMKALELEELTDGISDAISEYGIRIMGGDLNVSSSPWMTVAIIGYTTAKKLPPRNGARPGDYIVVTGTYGAMGVYVYSLKSGREYPKWIEEYTKRPKLFIQTAYIVALHYRSIHASMDVSDGLGYTLLEIARSSKTSILLSNPPVYPPELEDYCGDDLMCLWKTILNGGEEYGGVFIVDPRGVGEFVKELEAYHIPYMVIGRITEGTPTIRLEKTRERIEITRWDQFVGWRQV